MPTDVSYPGVYVAEADGVNLSVYPVATAVPIFALNNTSDNNKGKFDVATKVYSWADWLNKKGDKDHVSYVEDGVLKFYFANGGGPCYVVNHSKLEAQVPLYDDITLIASAGQDISTQVATLCQDGNSLFAILDGPDTEITSAYNPGDSFTANPYAAVYYPWFRPDWTDKDIPPSGAIAGIYCSTDRTRGVWKSPANVAIQGGAVLTYSVTDDLQGQFNSGMAINMIRVLDSRGPAVWGARTLEDSDNWRYICVRRLFNSAEKDIKTALRPMVFEPNNAPTWEKVRSAIGNYLHQLWRQGALVGATEAQAYFVDIGEGTTMSADDIAQGKMIVRVGMAAVRPAEFVILEFTQDVAGD